jgi:protein-S-isoprenylcysteine O-methyltransferase Ste14
VARVGVAAGARGADAGARWAWAVYLASPFAVVLCAVFVFYIGRFQIQPEERALSVLFGPEYGKYLRQVRRWL